LGVRDVLRERVAETLEDWTGLTLRPVDHVQALEESSSRWGAFADEAEDLAANVMDYVDGRPREVSHESRRTLSRRSRAAFIRDPLAGAEANLRANFSFGRGIPIPQAADEKVQKIIDAAWKDPNNERKLTSFEAQRHRSNDLLTTANLYAVGYEANGRFRVGFHDPDLVTEIVCHPEDEETPLWYVVRKKRTDWDFDQHHQEYRYLELKDGIERVYYVEHWRTVKDAEEQAAEFGMERPKRPNAEDVIPGRMEHFRINRVGRTQFGIPPWARTLRFYSAMNQITEAQVAMRQAAATIIAKRVRSGGPRDIMKAAANVMTGAGELASSRFSGNIRGAGPGTDPSAGAPPPPAGSHWIENESDRLEAVRLSSGSGEAMQDAQMVRAPLAASSGFGPHYLGDPSSTNLAGATALELPSLMETRAWQETFEGIMRWFTDMAIESAIRSGALGGFISEGESDGRPLQSLHLREDREELEERTGIDLSYNLDMPYPGRRNLPDVVNAITAVARDYDPMGQNEPMRRKLLDFLARHGLEVDDPAGWVDEVLPEGALAILNPPMPPPGTDPNAPTDPAAGAQQVARDPKEKSEKSQRGEKRASRPPKDEMGETLLERLSDPELERLLYEDVEREFERLLSDPDALLGGRASRKRVNGAAPAGPLAY
jgi:hypothetical protein